MATTVLAGGVVDTAPGNATLKIPESNRQMMEKQMSVMGVGAKIAVPVLAYTAVAEIISSLLHPLFRITGNQHSLRILHTMGLVVAATGFLLNLVAAFAMLKANREDRLATGGLYRLFRDPMYVLQIFLTLPGLFLLFNSWLVLTGVIPAYVAHRVFVKEEHGYLEERFREAYREYLKKVILKI
jgi:protein-S-isoprenylcysteine O-methyltransferase Ste14